MFMVTLRYPDGVMEESMVTFHPLLVDAVAERDATADDDEEQMVRVFRVVQVSDEELQQAREQKGQA
jgi:hypothetical protein